MLADGENGSISSKRVITFVATLLVAMAFVANLFWKLTIEEFMYSSMMTIILAGLGTTVAEKFAPKKKD
jgi:FtsH-binding integral membrane protein